MSIPLRVLISADMEGISGIVHPDQTATTGRDYERGRALMAADVNAVIAGVLAADESAQILVADAHGTFRNLLPEAMDERVGLISGRPRPLGMMAGLDEETDVVLFVGYHGRAGSGPGVLTHTMNGAAVLGVRLNGQPAGEIALNAYLAGHHGAKVVFLSGDDTACIEMTELLPTATTVAVKKALGQAAAELLHPARARERLAEAAGDAIRGWDQVQLLSLPGPVELEIDLYRPHIVDLAELVPGVRRLEGARTVAYTAPNMAEAYRMALLLVQLGQIEAA